MQRYILQSPNIGPNNRYRFERCLGFYDISVRC